MNTNTDQDQRKKRRQPGTGSVTRLKTGGHWVRVPVGGEQKPLGVYPTAEMADEVRVAAMHEMATAKITAGVTVRQWGVAWLAERELDGVRGIRTERSRWTNHIDKAPFADDPIGTVLPVVVHEWVQRLQQKKGQTPHQKGARKALSRKTVRDIVSLLKLAYRDAVARGLASSNPVESIKIRRLPTAHEPWTYALPEEQRRLLTDEEIPEEDRLIIAFALGTMVRQGEQFNLELSDVHVSGANPRIVVRFGSNGEAPKNGKIRTVPLFGIGLQAARRWLEILPRYCPKNPLNLLFPTPGGARRGRGKNLHRSGRRDGKPCKLDVFAMHLQAIGVVPARRHDRRRFRWHDLRHTGASSLVAGWWSKPGERPWTLEQVKEILGHSSITITQRYAHLAPGAIQELAGRTTGLQLEQPPMLRECDGIPSLPPPVPNSSMISTVGRQGLEPWTYGLKARSTHEQNQALNSSNHIPITSMAVAVLRAMTGGRSDWQTIGAALAEAVLAERTPRLAMDVLGGVGPLEAKLAELAGAVLDAAPVAVAVRQR
jgi:integrase